jgi:hypothetical protein
MKTGKKDILLLIITACMLCTTTVWAQVNISGKSGLIYIPTAELLEDGAFKVGYSYNPKNYAFRFNKFNYPKRFVESTSESICFINVALLPRFEINLNLLIPNGLVPLKERGIGDRQIDLKYILITEKFKRPSVAIICSTPFGVSSSLITTAVVASKVFEINSSLSLGVTAGFGSPYSLNRTGLDRDQSNILSGFKIENKRDLPYYYLSGPFGGAKLDYEKKGGIMIEWDSQHLNAGGYITLFKHWTIQAGLLNGDQLTASTSYALNMFQLPKRLRKHEKS